MSNKLELMNIGNTRVGDSVSGVLLIQSLEKKIDSRNRPYTVLVLTNGEDSVSARIWGSHLETTPGTNAIAIGNGIVEEFNGKVLKLTEYTLGTVDITEINKEKTEGMIASLRRLVNEVQDVEYSAILNKLLINPINELGMNAPFVTATAGRTMHHSTRGQLLQHTLEVTESAKALALSYRNELNLDLVITGALLHDYGKMDIYKINGFELELDVEEIMLDHLFTGASMVMNSDDVIPTKDKRTLLANIIGSHHNIREHGSIFPIATREAYVVHLADLMSSRMNMIDNKMGSSEERIFDIRLDDSRNMYTTNFINSVIPTSTLIGTTYGKETPAQVQAPIETPVQEQVQAPAPIGEVQATIETQAPTETPAPIETQAPIGTPVQEQAPIETPTPVQEQIQAIPTPVPVAPVQAPIQTTQAPIETPVSIPTPTQIPQEVPQATMETPTEEDKLAWMVPNTATETATVNPTSIVDVANQFGATPVEETMSYDGQQHMEQLVSQPQTQPQSIEQPQPIVQPQPIPQPIVQPQPQPIVQPQATSGMVNTEQPFSPGAVGQVTESVINNGGVQPQGATIPGATFNE